MLLLQNELEDFNSLKLKKLPIWLNKEEEREYKEKASVLIITETLEQAKLTHINIAGLKIKVFEFIDSREKMKIQT
jgi:hypothetical protein